MLGFAACWTGYLVRFRSGQGMARRRSRLADTIKHRPRRLFLSWRTPSHHHSPPLRLFGTTAMLSPGKLSVNKVEGASRFSVFTGLLAPSVSRQPARSSKRLSGFAAARCLREHPQCVGGFSAALLLKFVNPIGHGFNHIARRFTSGICLCLNDGAGFFALLYDSNCFLLRHCFNYRVRMNACFVSTNFSPHSSVNS